MLFIHLSLFSVIYPYLLFDQCYPSLQAWLEVNWLHGASVSASQRAGLIDWLVEVIPNTKYHSIIAHWRKYYVLL